MAVQRTEEGSDPNAPWTAILGIVGAILTFVLVVALQVVFYQVSDQEKMKKSAMPNDELLQIRATQQEDLHSYRYVDQTAGVVAIPIDQAMARVLSELGGERQPAGNHPSGSPNESGAGH